MRWSCPHCGVNLAVSDERLGSGWSFSRCYKCGGFALVRRSEVNLIKVDKAPVGENILLPEATETPVLSREAAKNLAQLIENKSQATAVPPPPPPPLNNPAAQTQLAENPVPKFLTGETALTMQTSVPHVVSAKGRYRLLPMAIGLAGTVAVASGVYLFLQGEAIWNRIHHPLRAVAAEKIQETVAANTPAETAAAPITTAMLTTAPVVTDQVHANAMAPIRENETNSASTAESNGDADDNSLVVRVKAPNSKLRSGPGLSFAIRGYANPSTEYIVLDWRDRWFKIGPKSAQNSNEYAAWIRNDLVEIIQSTN